MSDQVGSGMTDAAAVGLAFAFPDGLRGQLAALAAAWAPVEEAVATGSAGLVKLGLVTADLNGSAAVARPIGVGRMRRKTGEVSGPEQATGYPVIESGGRAAEAEKVRRSEVWITGDEAVAAPAVQVGSRVEVRDDRARDNFQEREVGPDVVMTEESVPSAAPVGLGVGFGRAGVGDGARKLQGVMGQEAVAPVASPVMVRVGREDMRAGGFERSGGQGGGGTMGRSVAPEGGTRLGLRADVGAVLAERAVTRGPAEAEPGSAGSAAFVRDRTRGSRPERMEFGFDGPSVTPGSQEAWAPQPAGRGTDGSGGNGMGVVQLDGRLVGQWLSDGMARDAARPGAGTTFFDPRQAPAWTPSGSL